jgi:hypothetical protein
MKEKWAKIKYWLLHNILKERWGFWKKSFFVSLIPIIVFLLAIIVFFCVSPHSSNVLNGNTIGEITSILLEINPDQDPDIARVIAKKIKCACKDYGMDEDLVLGIIEVESCAKIGAINPESGAMGLMQVLRTDKELEKMGIPRSERHRLLHIADNIFEGVKTLAEGFAKDGTVRTALFHYNGVHKNKYDGIKYVSDILSKRYDRECR